MTGSESSFVFRDYPKDNEHREDDLLFSTSTGAPLSRNTFRTRVRLPAIERSGLRHQRSAPSESQRPARAPRMKL